MVLSRGKMQKYHTYIKVNPEVEIIFTLELLFVIFKLLLQNHAKGITKRQQEGRFEIEETGDLV